MKLTLAFFLIASLLVIVSASPRTRRQTDVGVNVGNLFNMGLIRRGGWRDLGLNVLSGLVRVDVNRDPMSGRSVFVDVGGQPVFAG